LTCKIKLYKERFRNLERQKYDRKKTLSFGSGLRVGWIVDGMRTNYGRSRAGIASGNRCAGGIARISRVGRVHWQDRGRGVSRSSAARVRLHSGGEVSIGATGEEG